MTISLEQARRALDQANRTTFTAGQLPPCVMTLLKFAEAEIERQTLERTHGPDCWRRHHKCAVARLERLENALMAETKNRGLCASLLTILYGLNTAIREDAGKETEG